jgi:hypothetical protein
MPAQSLLTLRSVFTRPNMERSWRRTVRHGMRNQAFQDLYDYLDIHRHIGAFVWRLRADVISGRYRPNEATVMHHEKRHGISRRIMLLHPADALILQTVIDVIEPRLLRRRPTRTSYYARSHQPPSIGDVDVTFPYPWWELWPMFQTRIWGFATAFPFVVVTDVANYYDSIPLTSLRDTIASLARIDQPVLDLLFFLLESFVWRPHYIPFSGVGLPQINFDAPRLLAHAYLYPADRLVHASTAGNYVRWMDDINFGIDSRSNARVLLGKLDNELHKIGVRLNAGKTKILDSAAAQKHFLIQENRQLNIFTNSLAYGSRRTTTHALIGSLLRARCARFQGFERSAAWPKVMKRYLTAFGKLRDSFLEPAVPELLENEPNVRDSAFRYYLALGYSAGRYDHVENYLKAHCTDDVSLFDACRLLVQWEIPAQARARTQIVALATWLRANRRGSVGAISSGIWLMAKYATRRALVNFIDSTSTTWQRSAWGARQVAAVTPRLGHSTQVRIKKTIAATGLVDALQVLASLENIQTLTRPDRQLRMYLTQAPQAPYGYPFPKVLVYRRLLDGALLPRERTAIRAAVDPLLIDPVHREITR